MDMDGRDPRADPSQWPCYGNHLDTNVGANAHGQWVHCATCNLRLRYTPKKGSSSAHTKADNAFMTNKVLTELQSLMKGHKPTAAICLAMQRKVDAEETLYNAIDFEIDRQKTQSNRGYAKSKAAPSQQTRIATPPSSPGTSSGWDLVTPHAPQAQVNNMTLDEKEQLMRLLPERRQVAVAAVPVPTEDLATAYELKKVKPVTHHVAKKVMLMATTMMMAASSMLNTFALDDSDGLWEMACSPHSWLSEAAARQGLNPSASTWRLAMTSARTAPGKNFELFDVNVVLNGYGSPCPVPSGAHGQLRTTQLQSVSFCSKPSVVVNARCSGRCITSWMRPLKKTLTLWSTGNGLILAMVGINDLCKPFMKLGMDWLPCRIDGCRYHLYDAHGDLLKKKWKELFHAQFRTKVCVGEHCHVRIEGQETQKTAYYPKQMVESIARFWAQQNTSNRQIRRMSMPLFAAEHEVPDSPEGELPPVAAEPPSREEQEKWHACLIHFHKAAGHCSSRNLARIVKDANLAPWKVRMAQEFNCPTCDGLRPGGSSSGNVPPAATHAQFGLWDVLGLDVAEWSIPGKVTKQKFLLMIDMATRLVLSTPSWRPMISPL